MSRRSELPRIVDDPVVGFFRIRKTKGGPFVAARTFQPLASGVLKSVAFRAGRPIRIRSRRTA